MACLLENIPLFFWGIERIWKDAPFNFINIIKEIGEFEDKIEPFRDPLTKCAKDTASGVHDGLESEASVKALKIYDSLKLGLDEGPVNWDIHLPAIPK